MHSGPLALAYGQLPSIEIDVLHSQAAAFEQPQSGAVGQFDHQPADSAAPFDVFDQARNFLLGQNNWQAAALLRAEGVNRWELQLKYVFVEK